MNAEIDMAYRKLCEEYDDLRDFKKRVEQLQKKDARLFEEGDVQKYGEVIRDLEEGMVLLQNQMSELIETEMRIAAMGVSTN